MLYCYECFLKNNLDAIVCLPLGKHHCFSETLLQIKKEDLLKCLQKGNEISFFSLSSEMRRVLAFTAFYFYFFFNCLFVFRVFSFLSSILRIVCVVLRAEGRDERWSVLNWLICRQEISPCKVVPGVSSPWTLFEMTCNLVHFKGKTFPILKYLHEPGLLYLFPENNKPPETRKLLPSPLNIPVLFQRGNCSQ